jgi:hypothetical protein
VVLVHVFDYSFLCSCVFGCLVCHLDGLEGRLVPIERAAVVIYEKRCV